MQLWKGQGLGGRILVVVLVADLLAALFFVTTLLQRRDAQGTGQTGQTGQAEPTS